MKYERILVDLSSILLSKWAFALVVAFLLVVVLLVVVVLLLHNSGASGIVLFSFGFACLGMPDGLAFLLRMVLLRASFHRVVCRYGIVFV